VTVTRDPRQVVDVDHLVVALPLNDRTAHLFDAGVLAAARPGMHLVNVSRPQVVDQEALVAACAGGRLAATLDVTGPEPLPADHPLRSLPTVRLSPHVAWRSRASGLGYVDDFAAVVHALATHGEPPRAAWGGGDAAAATAALCDWGKERV
jgi:phosphoglycerate dehydrogenase-like enzyme